jgi:heme-degrading monooxygenase HmoA
MHVRMLWGRLRVGMWDEYERYYNENIASVTDGVQGFVGRQLIQSTENPDEGMSITLWESLDAMHSYERNAQRQQVAKGVEHLYTGEYWVRHFEVKSSTV